MATATHGFCPTCQEESAIDSRGACLWCGTAVTTNRVKGRYKRRSDTLLSDERVRALHKLHIDGGLSIRELAKRIWEVSGYASWPSAAKAIARGFHRLHLPIKHRHYPLPPPDRRCKGDESCVAFALEGDEFCWSHHPANRERVLRNITVATEARKGGDCLMANYTCANGHAWSGKSNLSRGFSPSELRCPEVGCNLPAEPKMKARASGMGSSANEPRVLADAHARFSSLVCEWPCFFADRRRGHSCWGPIDPHHLLPASWIKTTFRGLPDVELADILYAPIIGTPLCRKAHEFVEARTDFIYWHELDPELVEFCQRIGAKYPNRPSMLERLKLESPVRKKAA